MIRLPSMRAAWALLAVLLTFVISGPARAADDFLDPDKAFTLSVRVLDARKLELDYKAPPRLLLAPRPLQVRAPGPKAGGAADPAGQEALRHGAGAERRDLPRRRR